ncbi:MAG TPA: response regulator transcription factor [Candidatus Paceibacterota bacterium]|jgi:DNA-binding response OmpR family regulator|nr:response regulator transcription factor [Candidatus Paceibacterota bacterium]
MRILIIDDEEKLAKSLKRGLERSGYAVDYLLDGESGERRLELYRNDYDLVILDLMLPGKNGFEVCTEMRRNGVTTPVLILTARDATDDKVKALDSGGDDYLVKPFSFEELLARARALLRRPQAALPDELKVGQLTLKPAQREVYRDGKKVDLTLKEFELLYFLMRNPNKVLNREDIYVHLWDFAANSLSNIIDVHIKNLRKKLGDDSNEKILETVRGVGYRLKA